MIRLGFLELKVTRNRSLRLVPILVVPWVLKELRSPNSTPMEPYKLFESTMEDPNGNNNSSSIFGDKIIPTDWNSFKQKDLTDGINSDTPIVHSVDINAKSMSYASAVGVCSSDQRKSQLNFCTLVADKVFDGVNISIPRKVVEKGFFFFKFDSRAGLDAILEGGPWTIRNSLIILKKWSMNTSLQKEELTRIPIWVKLHDVPIQVFEEDGISLIDMYLGKPIMLDSYTSSMCIPDLDGPSHTKETIRVEYEWKPPRCPTCNIFGHTIVNRKRNNKENSAGNKIPKGVPVSKGFQIGKDFAYQPRASNVSSNGNNGTRGDTNSKVGPSKNTNEGASLNTKGANDRQQDTGKKKISNITYHNPFAALGVDDDEEEEVKNIWDESANLNLRDIGASTPA
ncbi:zinc knuckle CX2CX4HX4C containing protein [Tanacetum coccineum]